MPRAQGAVVSPQERKKQSSVPREKEGGARVVDGTREDGIEAILAPALATGEGCRVLIYGRTRFGKTSFARSLCQGALRTGIASTVLVHDPKYPDRPQYAGPCTRSMEGIGETVAGSQIAILRPPLTAADGALAARAMSEHGERCLLLVDETRRALGGSQKWADADGDDGPGRGPRNLEWLQLEGGGSGASTILLVQRPRQLPGDATDSAQVHVCFGLGGKSLAYLVDQGTVPRDAVETIKRLRPGAFCVFADDDDWNRVRYYSPL